MEPLLSQPELSWLGSPPLAFLICLSLALLLSQLGRLLTGRPRPSRAGSEPYASGEAARRPTQPGYGPFVQTAVFFALLHLGALMVATGGGSPLVAVYLLGLGVALIILLLG
jgi:hypothetical protein